MRLRLYAMAFVPLAMICQAAHGQSAAPKLFSFQGLSAASRRADVLHVFPAAKADTQCIGDEAVARSAEGTTDCHTLELARYHVNDLDFSVTFIFNVDGTLRYVGVNHQFGKLGYDGNFVKKGEISTFYWSFIELLSTKYGPAVRVSGDGVRLSHDVGRAEWQPTRPGAWQIGGDRINLSANEWESPRVPGAFWGSIQMFYTFAKRAETDRL